MKKTHRRVGALSVMLLGLAGAGTFWAAGASAHLTVAAPGVTAGASDAAITFRVPDESDTASTVGLKVQLPTDHPIAGALVAPLEGWSATIKQTKLAAPIKTDDGDITQVVSEIDWKADAGAAIKPGYFGQFTVMAGKLPDGVSSLTFKAIQTYSDRSVVSWIELPAPGSSAQPEHPAPTLELAAAPAQSGSSTAGPAASSSSTVASSVTAAPAAAEGGASKSAATTGILLGAIGVILGAAALVAALTRRRRGPAS